MNSGKIYSKSLRLQALESLKTHPWYSRTVPKLKKDGLDFCYAFIDEMGDVDADTWMYHVNRLFLGKEAPKYADVAQEILCVVGTTVDERPKRRKP